MRPRRLYPAWRALTYSAKLRVVRKAYLLGASIRRSIVASLPEPSRCSRHEGVMRQTWTIVSVFVQAGAF